MESFIPVSQATDRQLLWLQIIHIIYVQGWMWLNKNKQAHTFSVKVKRTQFNAKQLSVANIVAQFHHGFALGN